MNARQSFICILLLSLAAGLAQADNTKLFKWVDKDGVTHYGSSIPPEYASQQTEQLNSQGTVISTHAAQATTAQLAAQAAAKQAADQKAAADAAVAAHDKVLLDTYTSVADMQRDRDSKLTAIDAQLNVLNGTIAGLQNSLAEYQGRANEITAKNKPVPADLQKQINETKQELVTNQQQLLYTQQHKQQVSDQFTADMARFQKLTGAPSATTH